MKSSKKLSTYQSRMLSEAKSGLIDFVNNWEEDKQPNLLEELAASASMAGDVLLLAKIRSLQEKYEPKSKAKKKVKKLGTWKMPDDNKIKKKDQDMWAMTDDDLACSPITIRDLPPNVGEKMLFLEENLLGKDVEVKVNKVFLYLKAKLLEPVPSKTMQNHLCRSFKKIMADVFETIAHNVKKSYGDYEKELIIAKNKSLVEKKELVKLTLSNLDLEKEIALDCKKIKEQTMANEELKSTQDSIEKILNLNADHKTLIFSLVESLESKAEVMQIIDNFYGEKSESVEEPEEEEEEQDKKK